MEQWEKIHKFGDLGPIKYEPGDLVTRDGSDLHVIESIDYDYMIMTVRCIKEPDDKWIEFDETEDNLIRRYTLVKKQPKLLTIQKE